MTLDKGIDKEKWCLQVLYIFMCLHFAPLCHNAACHIVTKKISQDMPQWKKGEEGWWGGSGMPPQEDMQVQRTWVCFRNGWED